MAAQWNAENTADYKKQEADGKKFYRLGNWKLALFCFKQAIEGRKAVAKAHGGADARHQSAIAYVQWYIDDCKARLAPAAVVQPKLARVGAIVRPVFVTPSANNQAMGLASNRIGQFNPILQRKAEVINAIRPPTAIRINRAFPAAGRVPCPPVYRPEHRHVNNPFPSASGQSVDLQRNLIII